MTRPSRGIALGGVFTALSVVILWLGAVSGLGTYASPMLSGIALIPVGRALGRKYHVLCFIASGALCMLLSADWEMNLLFVFLLGWYPIVRPKLQTLRKPMRILAKAALFNVCAAAAEALTLLVIAPEAVGFWMAAALWLLGNVTLILYDFALPIVSALLFKRLRL
ncbi:MAG: hypothetical protein II875_10025 [Clostridia bacterium]|nr:hypothetical protein [Clostridia bacterium]